MFGICLNPENLRTKYVKCVLFTREKFNLTITLKTFSPLTSYGFHFNLTRIVHTTSKIRAFLCRRFYSNLLEINPTDLVLFIVQNITCFHVVSLKGMFWYRDMDVRRKPWFDHFSSFQAIRIERKEPIQIISVHSVRASEKSVVFYGPM